LSILLSSSDAYRSGSSISSCEVFWLSIFL
jgi:hypothetical protein